MKNRKLEIILLIIAIVLTMVNLIISVHQGISRVQIFIYTTDFILLLLWSYSVIKRRQNK